MSSDKDKVRPYHAPPASSGQETADAVKAVLHHAAERDDAAKQKATPKKQPKWMLPIGANMGVLALYLLIAQPQFVVLDPLDGPPAAQREDGLRVAMFLQAQQIEAYRVRTGRLPERLEEVAAARPGIDFQYSVVGQGQYQLVGTAGDQADVYDSSSQSLHDWVGAAAAAQLRGG